MSGELEPARPAEYLAGRARWAAIVVFAAVAAAGGGPANPSAAWPRAAGAVVAVGAGALLAAGLAAGAALRRARATAGIAVLGNGVSSNIGWFAVCLLAGWCVLAGSRRERPGLLGRGDAPVRGRVAVGPARSRAGAPGWPAPP